MTAPAATEAASRVLLLAALSAAGAAVTGLAETLRHDGAVQAALTEGAAWVTGEPVPMAEEAIDPLVDALRLTILAIGYPAVLHRIGAALDRYTDGDDA